MKRIYLSMLGMLLSAALFAVNVTFKVDMTGLTVASAGVHIAGSFQSEAGATGDWIPSETKLNDDGNGIWSLTVNIPAGYYEYKFINGASWGSDESPATPCNLGGNRAISVGSADLTIPTVAFGKCEANKAAVLFSVNLKKQAVINPLGVHVAGNFQAAAGYSGDWNPGASRLYSPDNDSVFKLVAHLPAGTYQYKFLNGNDWGDVESVPAACGVGNDKNREFGMDATVSLNLGVEFGECPPGVTFSVDMSDETVSPDGVHIAGSFQGWDPSSTPLTDKGSGIWEVTIQMAPGTYDYAFINGKGWGNKEPDQASCFSGGNRKVVVTGGIKLPTVKFGKCQPKVTLRVDLSNEAAVSPNGVHVAGAFQGWNPSATPMTLVGNNVYEVTLEMSAGTYGYKFVNGNAWGSDESVPGACNVGGNREVTIGTSDTIIPTVCFKQCGSTCVLDPAAADVVFAVDMSDPAITVDASGVWLMGSFTTPSWQDGRIQMTDADGDKVYSATVNISGAAEIQYKFSNGEPVKGSQFENGESGDFATQGCGVSNGIGGWNRVATRTGQLQPLDTVSYNSCSRLTSVKEFMQGSLSIYPNPAQSNVNISYAPGYNTEIQVSILDLTGKVMNVTKANAEHAVEINTQSLANGTYIIHVYDMHRQAGVYNKLVVTK